MREFEDFKFRGWHKKDKQMGYSDEIYPLEQFFFWVEYDCVLMQYTGLKDESGKEIYEGDIVKDTCFNAGTKIVKMDLDYSMGWEPFTYNGGGEWGPEACEVIGNIFENPELTE